MALRQGMAGLGLLLGMTLLGGNALAQGRPDSSSPERFTAAMAERFRRALPEQQVAVKGPLELTLNPAGWTARLDRVLGVCQRVPAECEAEANGFVERLVQSINAEAQQAGPQLGTLRAVLRPTSYVEEVKRATAGRPEAALVTLPFPGGLAVLLAFDQPNTIGMVQAGQLRQLDVNANDAFGIARRNLAVALPPVPTSQAPVPGRLGVLSGNAYESSRLLDHRSWRSMMDTLGGSLLVAAPSAETVVFGRGDTRADEQAMREAAADLFRRGHRPLATTVYRWMPTGWQPLGR